MGEASFFRCGKRGEAVQEAVFAGCFAGEGRFSPEEGEFFENPLAFPRGIV